jgi:hypothetical protein
MKWNYESKEKVSTGYEDLYPVLEKYTGEKYKEASQEEKQQMVEEVANIYKERNIFPITYFNEDGIHEAIQECIDYEPKIENDVVNTGAGVGTALCNFFMPNLFDAYNINAVVANGNGSANFKFHDDEFLRRCVRFALQCDGSAMPRSVMAGIRQVGAMPSNFRPMNAQAIYEKYCPEGGVIFDPSCGFGGRLTGALTSKKNFSYIGTEPNSETYDNLYRLGYAIEGVTGRQNSFKVIKQGSEVFRANPEIFDLIFTSPPYHELEHYTDEPTQCYIKFPNIYDWFDGFVKATIDNSYYMLKHDRYYAINIADFRYEGRIINYVDLWQELSEKAGFKFIKDLHLRIPKRAGSNMKKASEGKKERIMLFYKE